MRNGNSCTAPVPGPLELKTSGCHAGSLLMTGELFVSPQSGGEGVRVEEGHTADPRRARRREETRVDEEWNKITHRSNRLMRAALP